MHEVWREMLKDKDKVVILDGQELTSLLTIQTTPLTTDSVVDSGDETEAYFFFFLLQKKS